MELGAWLRSLGLEQYEAVFAENAIELSVLPDLTDQDLEKLGVLLGHRRKLLRAIASLEAASRSAPGIAVAPLPATAPRPLDAPTRDTAERRQVTVMFSDLVGSERAVRAGYGLRLTSSIPWQSRRRSAKRLMSLRAKWVRKAAASSRSSCARWANLMMRMLRMSESN
jgi:hypothetical protein